MKKTILVVGATGMLGEPVARQLYASGYTIRILSRTPDKAKIKFTDLFEVIQGDVEKPDTLKNALAGCYGVHINLSGGPRPEDYDRIEHRGTANVAQAASQAGVKRLTYLSGTSVRQENTWFYATKAKFQAEAAIRACGVPYSIFRTSWFMESLPLFVRGNRASMIGKQPSPVHWTAAADYARMVTQAYQTPAAENKTFYVYGPEAVGMTDALKTYCAVVHPEVKVSSLPVWLASLLATLTRNERLKDVTRLMAYYEKFTEDCDPTEANELLGTPTTTLQQWSEQHRAQINRTA
jgi:uncharacterized protein YbjT (DUF2867 family)